LNSFWALEFRGTVLLKLIWVSGPRQTERLNELIYKIDKNIMNMRKIKQLICLFISMLVGREKE